MEENKKIPGLLTQSNVITEDVEKQIVSWLDQQTWLTKIPRRTQHYGYEYNYTNKNVNPTIPLTGPIAVIANWLATANIITPTQCIVNEYTAEQGIGAHTDSPIFGPVVVAISLLAPTNMIFSRGTEKETVTLLPRSIMVMTGPARSEFTHEIPKRKTVTMTGEEGSPTTTMGKSDSYRRISLTFRTIA